MPWSMKSDGAYFAIGKRHSQKGRVRPTTKAWTLFAASVVAACGAADDAIGDVDYPSATEFASSARVGGVYSCATRSGVPLFFRIGAIDPMTSELTAYSVQIIPAVGGVPMIAHAPFVAESFAFCLPEDPDVVRGLGVEFSQVGFDGGYAEWKRAEGGVFTTEITQIYTLMGELFSGEGQ